MYNAAIYTRISQDREGAGLGVQRQEADCRELASRLGYEVVRHYSDNDISAYSGKSRPGYQQLLRDIEDGVVGAVIVWHTDRLHRSMLELARYVEVARDVPTHSVQAGLLDLATPSGQLTAFVTGAVAQHESAQKSARQRRKIEELVARGLPLGGGRAFGYEADGLTIRESEADELRAMVAKVLAGDSLASIIRDLNARGVLTTRGNQWGYTSLGSLLMRERNCGRMVHRGRVVGRAAWEPIITETDHDAVGAILSNPSRRTTTGPSRKHLLSGLLLCGMCGTPMKAGAVKSRGKHYNVYRCPARTGGKHVYRNKEKVEKYVIERVLSQLTAVLITPSSVDTAALEAERDDLRMRQDEMAMMFADGRVTASQLAAFTTTTNERLARVIDQLNATASVSALDGAHGMTAEEWDRLSLERKRRIIDALMVLTVEPVKRGPLPYDAGVAVKLRSDETPGIRTTGFGFRMPREIANKVRSAASPV